MENRELSLKDIAGYLPYGLRVVCTHNQNDFPIDNFLDTEMIIDSEMVIKLPTDKHRIALRPLSDLYRTITHNSEEIVPIVELAKIGLGMTDGWELHKYEDCAFHTGMIIKFWYNRHHGFRTYLNELVGIGNQYALFDYLHELKIDYRGLIDARLAIDCNTLEINIYK